MEQLAPRVRLRRGHAQGASTTPGDTAKATMPRVGSPRVGDAQRRTATDAPDFDKQAMNALPDLSTYVVPLLAALVVLLAVWVVVLKRRRANSGK